MLNYTRHAITPEDEAAVLRALRSDHLTRGPETDACEAELAIMAGCKHAVLVNSGTFALTAVGLYLNESEIRVPAISFMATASAFGNRVRFLDIQQDGLCPKADVVVTLGGRPMKGRVVDACHGPIQHTGTVATCLSFHPAKHVAGGEGGAVLTNLDTLASHVRLYRHHGRNREGQMVLWGTNGHVSELTAALIRSQLTRYHAGVARRRAIAAQYDAAFAGQVETIPHGPDSARHLYQLRVGSGQAFKTICARKGVGTQTHYQPIPFEPFYQAAFHVKQGAYPTAVRWARSVVSIPLYPTMTPDDVDTVIRVVQESV